MTENKNIASSFRMPWWGSLAIAISSYSLLKYLAPELNPTHPVLQELCKAAPTFAPLITIPFLLLAAKQLYDGDKGQENSSESIDDVSKENNE